ncbi:MAG: SbcC/MukB-like Walker B domain-containing protein, partial [Hespellia sp.]|nr:SbcC/MukB-like Walker B domain-containing protein [Hespellia sp.]
GQAYLEKMQVVEKSQNELQEQEQQKQDYLSEQEEKQHQKEQLEDRERLVQTELTSLLDTDMEEAELKLDKAKDNQEEARRQTEKWDEKMSECQSNLIILDQKINQLKGNLECTRDEFAEKKQELCDVQEELQWSGHKRALECAQLERSSEIKDIAEKIRAYQKQITAGKTNIEKYNTEKKKYDDCLQQYEKSKKEKESKEWDYSKCEDSVVECQDALIDAFYQMSKENREWIPEKGLLKEIEQKLREYEHITDVEKIRQILLKNYDNKRIILQNLMIDTSKAYEEQEKLIEETTQKQQQIREQTEIEPERSEMIQTSREALEKAGIKTVPFYKAVEFAEDLTEEECARLEMQLQMMGILDALVVPSEMAGQVIHQFPQLADTMLYVDKMGGSSFGKLRVNEELTEELKEATAKILSNIQEKSGNSNGIYIGVQGEFQQGILRGKSKASDAAAFIGTLARKRKKEQLLRELQEKLDLQRHIAEELLEKKNQIKERQKVLESEYQKQPNFEEINKLLSDMVRCELELNYMEAQLEQERKKAEESEHQSNEFYQIVLQTCKELPYGRTVTGYQEAEEKAEEYQQIWKELENCIRILENVQQELIREQGQSEREEERRDEAFQEKRTWSRKAEAFAIEVQKYEEYLNLPENKEKAKQIDLLKVEAKDITEELKGLEKRLTELQTRLSVLFEGEEGKKIKLQEAIKEETFLRSYFEEELDLHLVLERETKTIPECAKQAVTLLRDSDRGREPQDVLNALYRVYQQHNSNLSQYGTALEDCFEGGEEIRATRRRVRIASTWNGKKLYLEEFYQTIRNTIDETELLIQEKDRELFEDILSQTISQQLTDRIAESRRWVQDMSELMKGIDTSMGLTFSLSWKPKSAENDAELDTNDLEHILLRDRELLTMEDIERVARHFRSKIKTEKLKLLENSGAMNYMELVRDALDYRRWFEFQMSYKRNQEDKKILSNAAFNRFSGGEKAMAMYVPLFAAVNAQYKKASKPDHPRMIALDEAFAGVDDKNISSMFQLVESLDFDYIMNSQALWGCYDTVKGLKIAELLRPLNSQIITVIQYIWNGHERILNE